MRERRWQSWCHRLIKPECRLSLQINRNADGCNTRLPGVSFNFVSCAGCTQFPALGVGRSLPCLPGTRHTRQRLVSLGRMGRQESIGNNHEYTYAVVYVQLSVAFTSAVPRDALAFVSALAPEPCPSTVRWDALASATHGLSPLSSPVSFRMTFYISWSAVIVFWWSTQVSALPRFFRVGLCWQLGWWHWVTWPGQLVGCNLRLGYKGDKYWNAITERVMKVKRRKKCFFEAPNFQFLEVHKTLYLTIFFYWAPRHACRKGVKHLNL